jgi:DNA ligase-1
VKRFTQLYTELDQTNRTSEKVTALESYFREVPPADGAWALYFLSGGKISRAVTATLLQNWAATESEMPAWLFAECREAVGDLAETIALVLPARDFTLTDSLDHLVRERLLPLVHQSQDTRRNIVLQTWRELDARGRLVWNKLLTGAFRVGVAQTLLVRALAHVAGIDQAVMAHRILGDRQPTAEDFTALLQSDAHGPAAIAKPYPFFLASPLAGTPSELGEVSNWQVEWKWDGIRAQVIHRGGEVLIWSRGDELVTEAFPEIARAASTLPDGTVLDGEIVAWAAKKPQPFGKLQQRLGRKKVSRKLLAEVAVVFLAYDLLESDGVDLRARAFEERRFEMEKIISNVQSLAPAAAHDGTPELFVAEEPASRASSPLRISPLLFVASWEEMARLQKQSRARSVEGLMLKRRSSPYGVGRQRGDWWKWKIDPLTIDAVLVSAQLGHGRRASLYTDYTFGVWHENALVPVAKAYSGLTDDEILQVDGYVRGHTTGRFGPIRTVTPELVFELAFEAINESSRHKSGIALRFPRMNRWRRDKTAADADTLASLRALLPQEDRP